VTTPTLVDRVLRRNRWVVALALALAVTLSSVFILQGGGTGMSPFDMSAATGPAGALIAGTPDVVGTTLWTPGYAVVIFFMWWLMMIAMMVPSAAPTILLYAVLNRPRGQWAALEFLLGYLAVWAGFSLVATALQGALAAAGLLSAMYMNVVTPVLGGITLIAAGLYQFTPLKFACLSHCRGPVDAITRHRREGFAAAFRMGVLHGRYCLGCCWALMALLFVGGIMNLWWILGIAVYVAIEKLAPGGDKLAKPLGVVLILGGLVLLLRAYG
jgi:predicted metal-binding membrane protein